MMPVCFRSLHRWKSFFGTNDEARLVRRRVPVRLPLLQRLEDRITPSFYSSVNYPSDRGPLFSAVGDLNGDGQPDIVVANHGSYDGNSVNDVTVFLNMGHGQFAPGVNYSAGVKPNSVTIGDVNGDGIADLVIANDVPNSSSSDAIGAMTILLGNGDGTFGSPITKLDGGNGPSVALIGDFNGDGIPDIAVADEFTSSNSPTGSDIAMFLGKGNGTFAAPYLALKNFGDGQTENAVMSDLNGKTYSNGLPIEDLVIGNESTNTSSYGDKVEVLLNNGSATKPTFSIKTFKTPAHTFSVAVGDFNGDGLPDIATVNNQIPGSLSIFVNTGTSALYPSTPNYTYALDGRPTSVTVADMDLDGIPDLVITNATSNSVGIMFGNGDGSFEPIVTYATARGPQYACVADLNGDCWPDIVVADASASQATVLLNQGYGFFSSANISTAYNPPYDIAFSNFNGDGETDMATANPLTNTVSVLLNGSTDGTFDAAQVVGTVDSTPISIAAGQLDLKNNKYEDLVTANEDGNDVSVLLGNGDGTFQTPVNYAVGNGPTWVVVADMNGDGYPDLVVANGYDNTVSVLFGKGDGTFQAPVNYDVGDDPIEFGTTDMNGDGHPDIEVINYLDNTVTVLLNNGKGVFSTTSTTAVGNGPVHLTVNKFDTNNNSYEDIIVANNLDGTLTYLPGKNNGTFGTPTTIAGDDDLTSVGSADFNGDGKADLVFCSYSDSEVFVLQGNGNGTFGSPTVLSVGVGPVYVRTTDISGDGDVDIITANYGSASISVILGEKSTTKFNAAVSYSISTPNEPYALAAADFNDDGYPDLATISQANDTVSLVLGNGDGTFQNPYAIGDTGDVPYDIKVGDFNGDGYPDLVVANFGDGTISVFLNEGDGLFAPPEVFAVGDGPDGLAVGDLNNDGDLDIVVANYGDDTVSVLFGNGDGTFQSPLTYDVGAGPNNVALADLTGDGNLDIITANVNPSVSVLLNNGNGTFAPAQNYGLTNNPDTYAVAIADFNGDGHLDIATANLDLGSYSILLGNGDGTFGAPTTYSLGGGSVPNYIATADFSGDGKPDLVVAEYGYGDVAELIGVGDGTFESPIQYTSGQGPTFLAVADFNGDGAPDVAAIDSYSSDVAILLDHAEADHFTITAPSTVTAGTSFNVTVTAQYYCGDTATGYTGTVYFSSTDQKAGLPASYTFTAADQGVHTFNVTLETAGHQDIFVRDALFGNVDAVTGGADVTVEPAAPARLVFSVEPGNTTAGSAVSPAVKVQLFDAYGNLATNDYSDRVTLSVANGPGGFASGSTTTVTVSAGVATFSNLIFDTAGTYTLAATATGGVTGPDSSSFSITPASPAQLVFNVEPSNSTAGDILSPSVQVELLDRYGNLVTADNSDKVTLSVAGGPGGFAAGSTLTATASGGIATFTNLVLDTAGTYMLAENATGGLTGPNSTSFAVVAASPDHLGFDVQPSNTEAGAVISPPVTVDVFDKYGNLVTTDNTDQVSVNVASGPGGFDGASTTTVTVSGGIATFSNLILDTKGNYTLGLSGTGGLTGLNSGSFTIIAPVADHLVFSVQPGSATAGDAVSPPVQVEVINQFGQLFSTDNTDQVTLSIATGPAGFAAGSTTTVTVSNGIANFSNLILDTAGTYTLSEIATTNLSGANSSSFTVSAASPDHLKFGVQPTNTKAGVAISPPVTVDVFDKFGNLVTSDNSDPVTVAVNSGPGGFASGSTTTVTVSGGVATFSNLILDTVGTYSLTESATGGLAGPVSNSFMISVAGANHLIFSAQPGSAAAGSAIAPAVQVEVADAFGNLETTDNNRQVSLSVASGPGGFASGSTTTVIDSSGIATFSNLILDTAGTYTLESASTGLTGGTSNSFTVSAAAPHGLGFGVQPSNVIAGSAISPAVTVKEFDAYGNLEISDNSSQVTLSVVGGTFDPNATTTVTVSGGIATFSNLILDTTGTYRLSESATGGLSGTNSNSFTVSAASPDHLQFGVQPSNTTAGVAISPPVTVDVFDKFGNLVTSDNSDQVTVAVNSGPGGFASGSTTTVTVSGGVATFSNLIFDTAGTYTLKVGAPDVMIDAVSNSFTVSAAAANHLIFSAQPGSATAGLAIAPAVQVEVVDAFGNLEIGENGRQVSLSVFSGPGVFAPGSTTTVIDSGGVATFSNLILDTAGSYTLAESASGPLTGSTSNSFTVSAAAPHSLNFGVQPSNVTAGSAISPAVTVKEFDAYGNLVMSDNSGQVTLSIASGPGIFDPNATTTATVSGGIATFSNLIFDTTGSYTLGESGVSGTNALTGPNSASFIVNPGAANHLLFLAQPVSTKAGSAISPSVKVEEVDFYGNQVTTDNSHQVTLTVASGPGGFVGGSTTTATVSNGIATFSNLILDTAGSYNLAEIAGVGLTGANSNSFAITSAGANHLGFSTQPANATAGLAVSPAVTVEVFDLYGNQVTSDNSDQVTVSIAGGPGGFAGGSTTTATVSGGTATFSNLILDTAGIYTLNETATGGLSGPVSGSFTVSPGTADHLGFGVQPGSTTAGLAVSPAVTVKVFDQYNNLLTGDNSDQVTLSIASGPGGFASTSTTTVTVSGGIATFGNLVLDAAGSYMLGQSGSNGLAGPSSGSFTVSPAAASQLSFLVQPGGSTAGSLLAPAVKVEVLDPFGNLITTDNSHQVTLFVASGPGGFTGGSTTTATVSGGVATFSNLVLDIAGTYTLGEHATGGLIGSSSSSFTVNSAGAHSLAFGVQPTNATAGLAVNPAVTVEVLDTFGNLVTADNSDQVTLAVASGPGGFTAGNSITVSAVAGVATFSNLIFDTAGTYTLAESATNGLAGSNSGSFTVSAAAPDHLGFAVQPSNTTAGTAIKPPVKVHVFDQYGNLVTSDNSDQVTLSVAGGPAGLAGSSTTTATVSGGVATFNNLILDTAGSYQLAESATGGLIGPDSGSFSVSPAAANHLGFGVQPSNGVAGSAIAPAVTVQVFDQFGNLVLGDNSDQVSLNVASGPGGFASASTTTATVNAGVATFYNLILDGAGSYILAATATGGLTGPNSGGFTISAASANHLEFITQPSNVTAGVAVSPAVTVEVLDAFGNPLVNDNSDQVTLSVASGPGGFAGGATTTATVSAGVATFGNVILDSAGSYSFGESAESASSGIGGSASSNFNVGAAAANHLGFAAQPGTATAGGTISPAVTVQVLDAFGNPVTTDDSDQVTLGVASGPGGFAGGSTTTATVHNGVAVFGNLVLDAAGMYTLSERAAGGMTGSMTGPSSAPFTVLPGAGDHLAFTVEPSDTTAGIAIGPAVQVELFDRFGNLLTTDSSDQVSLSLASGPGGFSKDSTTTETVSGGIATFNNLVLDKVGTYTLGDSATVGKGGAVSTSFTVSHAAAEQLAFSVEPSNTSAGSAINPAVQVQVLDAFGNPVGNDNSDQVSVSIVSGKGGFASGSTTTAPVSGGVATFGNLLLDTAGLYILGASSSSGLTGKPSSNFAVTAAIGFDHLGFSEQQGNVVAGTTISPALQVDVLDPFGNLVTTDNGDQVSLSVAGGPGGFATGSTTVAAVVNGVATFGNLAFDTAGSGYSLTASSNSGLPSATTNHFAVTAAKATQLVVTVGPLTSYTVEGTFEVVVSAEDPFGNIDLTFGESETIALQNNSAGATLGGTLTVTANNGVAIFTGLNVNKVSNSGYQLQVTAQNLSPVSTNAFDVTAGTATHLAVISAPAGLLTANVGFNVEVAAEDRLDNIDTTFTGNIDVTLASSPAGGILGGPMTAAAQHGVATFSGLTLSQGGPYVLNFSAGNLTSASLDVNSLAFQRTLPAVQENATAPAGVSVSTLLQGNYSGSKPGIAVTQTSGNGNWQFSTNGKSWSNFSSVSTTQALLLPGSYQIRFIPALNSTGTASLLFVGWDGASGTAGGLASVTPAGYTTAFSVDAAEANVSVISSKRAPAWLPGSVALTPILPGASSPAGQSVSSIFGTNFSDYSSSTTAGVAVVGLTGTNKGTWQYSLNTGASWNAFGTVSAANARLLSGSDEIRFLPNSTGTAETATLQAYAWDGSTGTDGKTVNLKAKTATGGLSAFSATTITAGFAINDAPGLFSSTGLTLPAIQEDGSSPSIPVSQLLNSESDVDYGALKGVAIVAASGPGTWQFSLNGATWQSVGAVSESTALLLSSNAKLRFMPGLHQSGQASITYRAWDQTAGTSGTLFSVNGTGGAFSLSSTKASATLSVAPVNHAPTWTGRGPELTPILPGSSAPSGETIDEIFSNYFNDVDSGTTPGIAVTALTGTSQGSWQYLLNNGTQTWQPMGSVTSSTALLLSGLDRIRFQPSSPSFSGNVSLQANAWDGSSGSDGSKVSLKGNGATGGHSAFSSTSLTATLEVNTAPVWIGSGAALTPILTGATNPAGDSVAAVFGPFFNDGASGTTVGIAVTALTGTANGTWQYLSASGGTWTNISAVSTKAALLLSGNDLLRFKPNASFSGTVSLQAYAWNGGSGSDGGRANLTGKGKTGGSTAFSTTTLTATCLVNSAPVLEA